MVIDRRGGTLFPLSDPILVFTILVLVILVAPLLAERLRVPDLVLMLLAGTLLGPHGFGILERNPAVTLFGSVGLLFIMFLAGLEIDLHRFARSRRRSVLFGLLTFAIPQGLGTIAGRYMLGFEWPTAILLASMFASHTLLAYPIASRLGVSRSEPVAVTVGATILTDTLALLVLAVIADSARGVALGVSFWIGIAAGMAALVLLTWLGIPRLTRWFFHNVTEAGGAQFLFVLVTVCGCAYLSHFAKMEPIVGAFLAGAAFSRLIPEHSALMNRIVFTGNTLFIPFFLISVGMLVDPGRLMAEPRSWLVAGAMIGLVVVTKYAAAWLARKLFGYDSDAGRVMFGLSVVQAAATLAAVLVGYDLKIFDETVLNGAIAMIAVTCPLGAWVVDRYGRKLAEREKPRERPVDVEQRLLVAVANPATATRVLDLSFLLRNPALPGAIHPITIVYEEEDTEEAVARGEKLLADCLTQAASADIPVTPSVRVDLNPSDGIIRAAKELRSSAVLVGWRGIHAVSVRFFGTIRENLLDDCPPRLYFCRLVGPLNTARRMVLLFPPLAERRSDLPSLLRDVKFLSKQIGVELRAYLVGKETGAFRRRIETTAPSRPVTFIESKTTLEARVRMFEQIAKDDLLLVLGERRSSVLWTPTLDKFSELLIARFPENNLLLAYPPLASYGEWTASEFAEPPAEALTLRACDLGAECDLERAIVLMTTTAFPDGPEFAEEARRLLRNSAGSYPVELSSEAVLVHAHCEGLDHPVLIIGRGPGCLRLPTLRATPRIILGLLSPAAGLPERHLKLLATLGRRFHDEKTVDAIHHAASAAEIGRILEQEGEKA